MCSGFIFSGSVVWRCNPALLSVQLWSYGVFTYKFIFMGFNLLHLCGKLSCFISGLFLLLQNLWLFGVFIDLFEKLLCSKKMSLSCSYFLRVKSCLRCYIDFDTFIYLPIQFWHICVNVSYWCYFHIMSYFLSCF